MTDPTPTDPIDRTYHPLAGDAAADESHPGMLTGCSYLDDKVRLLADKMRNHAETYLYDGDTDQALTGYEELLTLADQVEVSVLPIATAVPAAQPDRENLEAIFADVIATAVLEDRWPRSGEFADALIAARSVAHSEAADRDDEAAIAGYVVAGYEHGKLVSDWDGEVHATRESGLASLTQCRETYPDWDLYELHPATTEGAELRRSDAEATVERVRSLLNGRRKTVPADNIRAALAALREKQ